MIPTVEDVRSARLEHRPSDLFNPPALTNRLGCVQADVDPVAIRSLSFPPFGAAEVATAATFLDGTYFGATGAPVAFTWRPDRIVREASWNGWRLRSVTALAVGRPAAMVLVEVTNEGPARDLSLRLGLRSAVAKRVEGWREPVPPVEYRHDVTVEPATGAVRSVARASGAVSVQAALPAPERASPEGMEFGARLRAGGRFELRYVCVFGDRLDEATETARALLEAMPEAIEAAREDWDADLRATFTPEGGRYAGSLPVLETADENLRRVYALGALGVTWFRREGLASAIGRSYDTLMPRYWQTVTFLWDYSLSGLVHALLDPATMRRHLELWMSRDVHTCFGTEWLTGGPVGPRYAVNDFAMTAMIREYLRWTGDLAWLDAKVPDREGTPTPVATHLERYARNWERFRTHHGLADYGGIGSLLECVSTYVHEVAALNAANVWGLRAAAEVAEARGEDGSGLRASAAALAREVRALYADGRGYWHARHPDGRLVPVRHCYDFVTVLGTMPEDLSEAQRQEMAGFFLRELATPTWMRALSASDPDAMYSVRPDHQWTGAYAAWPPLAVAALYRAGRADEAFEWLKGLARSGNQGPYGQAHFVESYVEPDAGGARKAPGEFPYITDWASSSGGAWVQMVIGAIFGVEASVDGTLAARPAFGPLDPSARLRGLAYQGRLYDVDRNGIREARG